MWLLSVTTGSLVLGISAPFSQLGFLVLDITLDASGGSLQLVESSSGGAQVETLETASGHCSDRESDQLDAELQTKSSLKRVPLLFSV